MGGILSHCSAMADEAGYFILPSLAYVLRISLIFLHCLGVVWQGAVLVVRSGFYSVLRLMAKHATRLCGEYWLCWLWWLGIIAITTATNRSVKTHHPAISLLSPHTL